LNDEIDTKIRFLADFFVFLWWNKKILLPLQSQMVPEMVPPFLD
jgi:hypothetical protein